MSQDVNNQSTSRSLWADPLTIGTLFVIVGLAGVYLALVYRFHLRPSQIVEGSLYLLSLALAAHLTFYYLLTRRKKREENPFAPVVVSERKDRKALARAAKKNATVLGFDIHGEPIFWPDDERIKQAIACGASGSGKSTLLRNIITQDIHRIIMGKDRARRLPIFYLDGKGDTETIYAMAQESLAAGRMHQLRILDLTRPEFSIRFNPLYAPDGRFRERAAAVFRSFGLERDFFCGHQEAYFDDLVHIMQYTGKIFTITDILVLLLDVAVLREQMELAKRRVETMSCITAQQRKNFAVAVANIRNSFDDKERGSKLQGLVNELKAYTADEISVITESYENLFTFDQLLNEELIVLVRLNATSNSSAVSALGKMLLESLQITLSQRYDNVEWRKQDKPMFSIILDEIGPFAYRNFARILQTARGTNTAFLFSVQSVSQFDELGRAFRDEVVAAPGTKMILHSEEQQTVEWFLDASSVVRRERRTTMYERVIGFLGDQKREVRTYVTEVKEPRALDEHIKNLPVGQMQILTPPTRLRGPRFSHVHIRVVKDRPLFPGFELPLYRRLVTLRARLQGANLEFKNIDLKQEFRLRRRSA